MVKAKKMSNDIKKYIKYVKKIIPIHSKDKKEFIQLLYMKKSLNFLMNMTPVVIKIS